MSYDPSEVSFLVHVDVTVRPDGTVLDRSWTEPVPPAKRVPSGWDITYEDGRTETFGAWTPASGEQA